MFWTWNIHIEINLLHEVQDQPICLVPKQVETESLYTRWVKDGKSSISYRIQKTHHRHIKAPYRL